MAVASFRFLMILTIYDAKRIIQERTVKAPQKAYLSAILGDVDDAILAGLYSRVATLEAAGLDEVFRATNSIDENWFDAPGSGALIKPVRSTSVGDIVIDATGEASSCSPFGWTKLSPEKADLLCAALPKDTGPSL